MWCGVIWCSVKYCGELFYSWVKIWHAPPPSTLPRNTPPTEPLKCLLTVFCLLKRPSVSSLFSVFFYKKHKIFNFTIPQWVFITILQKNDFTLWNTIFMKHFYWKTLVPLLFFSKLMILKSIRKHIYWEKSKGGYLLGFK